MTAPAGGLAPAVAELAWRVTGRPLAVGVRAYDGSRAGPDGEPRVEIGSPAALRRMFWNPGELGVADAYVAGDLRVHGDLVELLRVLRGSSAGPGCAFVVCWCCRLRSVISRCALCLFH